MVDRTIVSEIYNNTIMKHTIRRSDGFTLLELLVTSVMIAVLTIIGIVSYSSVNKRSRDVKRKSDLEQIRSALEMFRSDNKYYPFPGGTPGGWHPASSLGGDLVSTYIPAIPSDPVTSQGYHYREKNLAADGNYYGYCVCACLESSACNVVISNTCEASDVNSSCNYYLKNP